MKKHELLKHAYDNYPKGTKFITQSEEKTKSVSSGVFKIGNISKNEKTVYDTNTSYNVYDSNKGWAEIVTDKTQKIAVKVEDEKEYYSLMKYYESLGWTWNSGCKPLDFIDTLEYPNFIRHEDRFLHSLSKRTIEYEDRKILSFPDFAKEHNIKLPLIKSEDGVWLYEEDRLHRVYLNNNGKWEIMLDWSLSKDSYVITHPEEVKAFYTKQSALDWIEAQKPKRNYLSGGQVYFEIIGNEINFMSKITEESQGVSFLTKKDLELINNAIQELS